jgi:hypothetical protein
MQPTAQLILKEYYLVDEAANIVVAFEYEHCSYLEKQSIRDELLRRMRREANEGKLTGYDPEKKASIQASWYDVFIYATPQALDTWLDEHVPDIKFRFSAHAFKGFIVPVRPSHDDLAELRKLPPNTLVDYYEYSGGTGETTSWGQSLARRLIEGVTETILRQAGGYFTIAEAAQILGGAQRIDDKGLIKQMLEAHAKGVLVIREAESRMPLLPNMKVRQCSNLVKVVDIDAWLESIRMDYRFPPAPAESKPKVDHGDLNHNLEWQKRANEIAAELKGANPHKRVTKGDVAKKLAPELNETQETVVRRIRNTWQST